MTIFLVIISLFVFNVAAYERPPAPDDIPFLTMFVRFSAGQAHDETTPQTPVSAGDAPPMNSVVLSRTNMHRVMSPRDFFTTQQDLHQLNDSYLSTIVENMTQDLVNLSNNNVPINSIDYLLISNRIELFNNSFPRLLDAVLSTLNSLTEVAAEPPVTGQEALVHYRQQIRDDYINMATSPVLSEQITQVLPCFDDVIAPFDSFFEDMTAILDIFAHHHRNETIRFRVMNAKRALQLISGDVSVEHHPISTVSDYGAYAYGDFGMPSLQQLYIVAWRLCQVDVRAFLISHMAITCPTASHWQKWRVPFMATFGSIVGHDTVPLMLQADKETGDRFMNALIHSVTHQQRLPSEHTGQIIYRLQKAYMRERLEVLMPVIEALFMVMRGHNTHLLDVNEPNKPACAEGAYLGILKCIGEMLQKIQGPEIQGPGATAVFAPITLDTCEG